MYYKIYVDSQQQKVPRLRFGISPDSLQTCDFILLYLYLALSFFLFSLPRFWFIRLYPASARRYSLSTLFFHLHMHAYIYRHKRARAFLYLFTPRIVAENNLIYLYPIYYILNINILILSIIDILILNNIMFSNNTLAV